MTKPALSGKPRGRQKGVKNRKTVALARTAMVLASGVTRAMRAGPRGKVRLKAQPGISPKDLMLSAMRDHWTAAHALNEEAVAAEQEADKLPELPPDPLTGALSAHSLAMERARYLQHAASEQVAAALEAAAKVAPYEHAKLANQDVRLVGALTVTLKRYAQ